MLYYRLMIVTVLGASFLLSAQNALAFSVDNSIDHGANASRYADPEDQAEQRLGISDTAPADPLSAGAGSGAQLNMNSSGNGPAFFMQPITPNQWTGQRN